MVDGGKPGLIPETREAYWKERSVIRRKDGVEVSERSLYSVRSVIVNRCRDRRMGVM